MTNRSKVNPSDPAATDYTWQTKHYGTIKAGKLSDGRDACYLEDLQLFLEPAEAIGLATDLLRWAQFMDECVKEAAKEVAEEEDWQKHCSLLKRQAD